MADPYVLTSLISASGALLGALGGVTLNSWATVRTEDRRAQLEEKRRVQQRADQQAEARWTACADLLAAAAELRVQTQVLGPWRCPDMDVRLAAVQGQATAIGRHGSRVVLLAMGEDTSAAAQALAESAGDLAAQLAGHADLDRPGSQPGPTVGGVLRAPVDLAAFDLRVDAFRRAASGEVAAPAPGGPVPTETGPAAGAAVAASVAGSPGAS
jgi:hypothetical protein